MTLLARTGVVVRGANGRLAVVFGQDRCRGCDGRCGLRLGRTPSLALPDLRAGSAVEVVVAAKRLQRCAAVVFGVPLAATVGLAAFSEGAAWRELWVLAATLVGLAASLLVGRLDARQPWSVARQGDALRVELR